MVKTPRTQHSKNTREPVTIDLPPGEVSRIEAEAEKNAATAAPEAAEAKANPDAAPDMAAKPAEAPKPAKEETPAAATSVPPTSSKPIGSTSERLEEKPKPAEEREKPKAAAGPSPSPAAQGPFGRRDPEPPAQNSGGLRMAVAGLLGGLVVLILAGALQFGGLLPAAVNANQQAEIEALRSELAAMRAELAGAGDAGAAALGDSVAQAEERIAALSTELETLRGDVAGAGGEAPDLAPLEGRIAALETAISDLGENGAPALDAVESELAATREAQETAAGRLDALEEAIASLRTQVEEQEQTPATAAILTATSLKSAIDRGEPFAAELDAYATLAPDSQEVAQLRALAAQGVPTRAEIASEVDAAATAMIEAARPADPEAGLFDRLWSSAQGMVNVRPVGMVEGEGVPETVARLEAAVEANDYARAITEYESLPEEVRSAGQDFMAKVRARQSADNLIDQAMAAALRS